ncbi:MAG: hypothetical protein WC716_04445 [Chitinophagaceae bacterium]|jgi:hypothetical protein
MIQKKVSVSIVARPSKNIIYKTTYHYWRNWIRKILIDGNIKSYKFYKDKIGYSGEISVDSKDVDFAKKLFADYIKQHPEIKEMWWS